LWSQSDDTQQAIVIMTAVVHTSSTSESPGFNQTWSLSDPKFMPIKMVSSLNNSGSGYTALAEEWVSFGNSSLSEKLSVSGVSGVISERFFCYAVVGLDDNGVSFVGVCASNSSGLQRNLQCSRVSSSYPNSLVECSGIAYSGSGCTGAVSNSTASITQDYLNNGISSFYYLTTPPPNNLSVPTNMTLEISSNARAVAFAGFIMDPPLAQETEPGLSLLVPLAFFAGIMILLPAVYYYRKKFGK
jgi:hypothetical protein